MRYRATIYGQRTRGRIAPQVYGHFIEHLGRCVYDGIWVGPHASIPQIEGIRQEAIDVFRAVRAPLIRWPGGYFADCYDWRDGIGPGAQRPLRFQDTEPRREEPNHFGTHEFMRLCELTGAEPNLCVNTATLTAAAAADWVEYCNHDGRTSQAERRRQNGRSAPWNVKWWAIGNEAYWNHRPQDYVQKYLLWRQRMRRVDPHIQCIASLVEPTWHPQPFSPLDDWLPEVIGGIREHMELASLHLYSQSGPGDGFTEQDYWRVLLAIDQRNRQRIESFLGAIDAVIGDHRVKLALDEWGLWHAGVPGDLEQPCTQRDALFAARYFHLLQRYPERVGLATIAQSVNVLHALLRTDGPRSYRTPTFHVFEMFQDHQGGSVLDMLYESPQRDVEAMTEAGPKTDIVTTHNTFDLVTASASRCADGRGVLLTWTNADLEKGYEYEIDWVGTSALTGAAGRVLAADPHAQNTFDEPERVQPRPAQATVTSGRLRLTLPPCSVAALRLSEAPAGQPG